MTLTGRVVTMDDDFTVHARGAIYVDAGKITAVQDAAAPAPDGFQDVAPVRLGRHRLPGTDRAAQPSRLRRAAAVAGAQEVHQPRPVGQRIEPAVPAADQRADEAHRPRPRAHARGGPLRRMQGTRGRHHHQPGPGDLLQQGRAAPVPRQHPQRRGDRRPRPARAPAPGSATSTRPTPSGSSRRSRASAATSCTSARAPTRRRATTSWR